MERVWEKFAWIYQKWVRGFAACLSVGLESWGSRREIRYRSIRSLAWREMVAFITGSVMGNLRREGSIHFSVFTLSFSLLKSESRFYARCHRGTRPANTNGSSHLPLRCSASPFLRAFPFGKTYSLHVAHFFFILPFDPPDSQDA